MRTRPLPLLGVVLAAAALVLGPAGAGHADESEDTGISVTIPDVGPTGEPTDDPTDDPTGRPTTKPGDTPADGPGDGPGGAGGGGSDGGSDAGSGGGGSGGDGGTGGSGGTDGPGDTGGTGGSGPADDAPGSTATPAPDECVPSKPAVPTEPAADGGTATLDEDVRVAGEEFLVRGKGFEARERVQVVLFTEPQVVSTARADGRGVVEAPVTVPEKVPSGPRAVQLTGWCGQVALAQVLVASPGEAAAAGIPPWAWWTGGGVGLAGLGVGGWYVFRMMRAPGAGLPVAEAGATL